MVKIGGGNYNDPRGGDEMILNPTKG